MHKKQTLIVLFSTSFCRINTIFYFQQQFCSSVFIVWIMLHWFMPMCIFYIIFYCFAWLLLVVHCVVSLFLLVDQRLLIFSCCTLCLSDVFMWRTFLWRKFCTHVEKIKNIFVRACGRTLVVGSTYMRLLSIWQREM